MVCSRSVSARCPCFSQAFPRAHARPTRARPLAHRHNITHSNLHAHIHMHNCDALARARALARTFARVPCSRCMPTRKPCAHAPSTHRRGTEAAVGQQRGGLQMKSRDVHSLRRGISWGGGRQHWHANDAAGGLHGQMPMFRRCGMRRCGVGVGHNGVTWALPGLR